MLTILLLLMKYLFYCSALNSLVKKLEKRLPRRDGDGQFKFKKRVLGNPSELEPPVDYVLWAVDYVLWAVQDTTQDITENCLLDASMNSSSAIFDLDL